MRCIGGCPGESASALQRQERRPSQLTIDGVSAEVCGACGEVVYGSRRFERRMIEARRSKTVRRAMKVDLRRVAWGGDRDVD